MPTEWPTGSGRPPEIPAWYIIFFVVWVFGGLGWMIYLMITDGG